MTGMPVYTLQALATARVEDLHRSASRRRRKALARAEADQVIDLSRFEDQLAAVADPPASRPETYV